MAMETIDLTSFRDTSGSRVPEGNYLVKVEHIDVGQSSKGDKMWTVYLEIVGGEHDGMTLVDRLTHTERAMFRVVGFLRGMGIKTPKKRIQIDLDRLVGKKVRVDVADGDPYRGTIRSEVQGYIRFAAEKPSDATDDDFDDIEEAAEAPEPVKKKKKAEEPVAEESETVDDADLDLDDIDV